MERFFKEITHNDQKWIFDFTWMRNTNGVKYFVTSKDAKNKPFSFSLIQKEERNWKLMPGALRWLYEIEGQLSAAIVDNKLKNEITIPKPTIVHGLVL